MRFSLFPPSNLFSAFSPFLSRFRPTPVVSPHASRTLTPRYRRVFELNTRQFANFLDLQRRKALWKPRRFIHCVIALYFPYDYAKIFVLSKTFVCIYYTRSIRIGSTNKTGQCAMWFFLARARTSEDLRSSRRFRYGGRARFTRGSLVPDETRIRLVRTARLRLPGFPIYPVWSFLHRRTRHFFPEKETKETCVSRNVTCGDLNLDVVPASARARW